MSERLELTVGKGEGFDYATVGAALAAVPFEMPATVYIAEGEYYEKLHCEKKDIELAGAGASKTVLTYDDGGYHPHPDGRKYGTFRSPTVFFKGERLRVTDMTIQNTVGEGRVHGQGVAAAVESQHVCFERVTLLACQDTLYTGPLPEEEREPDGFLGPSQHAPRLASFQCYKDCTIEGDIDFIYGGANALFEGCTILCRGESGYVTAPCTLPGQLGYVLAHCTIRSSGAPEGSFWLGRPWRPYGAAAFLWCEMDEVIKPEGFSIWNKEEDKATSRFAEFGSIGPGASENRAFGTLLNEQQAKELYQQAVAVCCNA